MKTIKKLCVYHRRIVDGGREYLEQFICKSFHGIKATICNGKVIIDYDMCEDNSLELNVVIALFRAMTTDGKSHMPSNWREIAQYWKMWSICTAQVEEQMHCHMCDIPDIFFIYAEEFEKEYEDWCQEQMTSCYYDDQL